MSGHSGHSALYALSFRSTDAERLDDGGYRFTISSANSRFKANRVTLASLEVPFSQYSIEEEWNRLGVSERQRIELGARELCITETAQQPQSVQKKAVAALPLHLNPIVGFEWQASQRLLSVRTEHPHALWSNGICAIPGFHWAPVELIATAGGDYDLLDAFESGGLTRVDEFTFTVQLPPSAPPPPPVARGYLFAPSPPAPIDVCELLTAAFAGSSLDRRYELSYCAETNRAKLQARYFPDNVSEINICVTGDALLGRLGYTNGACRSFRRLALDPSSLGPGVDRSDVTQRQLLQATQNLNLAQPADVPPLTVPSADYAYSTIQFRPGAYTPARRSFAQPRSFAREFELQFNRFFLPPREEGTAVAFIDPFGRSLLAPLMVGRYTPVSLATTMEVAMNNVSSAVFRVRYTGSAFTFTCVTGAGAHREFSLRFHNPRSIEPERLGFEAMAYEGSSAYASMHEVLVPQLQWPPSGPLRMPTNMYQIIEDAPRSKLRIAPMAPPRLTAVISSYAPVTCILRLDVFLSNQRCAHGLQDGDVVQLAAPSSEVEIVVGGGTVAIPPADPGFTRGVVQATDDSSLDVVTVLVGPAPWLDAVGKAVTITMATAPSNFNFARMMPRTMGGRRLGFENRAYQWGRDGMLRTPGGLKIPPFDAPGSSSFDIPEYVLFYIREGQKSSLLHHHTLGTATKPLAKIVFGTQSYKEERALTRELVLSSGESLSRFTIDLKNPDGSNWQLHGQEFSFTLNLAV